MSLVIRRCRAADAPALTAVAHAAKRHWGYPEELIRLWSPALTLTPEFLASADTYAAVEEERVIGVCAIGGEGIERELEHLWVLPACIGRGIGRRLLGHALRRERARGTRRLRIASDPHAEGFYARLGAQRVGVVLSTPPGRELPLLELDLTPAGAGIAGKPARPGPPGSRRRRARPPGTRSR